MFNYTYLDHSLQSPPLQNYVPTPMRHYDCEYHRLLIAGQSTMGVHVYIVTISLRVNHKVPFVTFHHVHWQCYNTMQSIP
jgi:hypothetical protein